MKTLHAVVKLPAHGQMNMLTRAEIDALLDVNQGGLHELFRRCVLAVLNSGSETDNVSEILEQYRDFRVNLAQRHGTLELQLENAPADAFVDGTVITGVQENLHAVLRDILFVHHELSAPGRLSIDAPADITDTVFHILRNARVLRPSADSRLVVCWGGHSISRHEYEYTKHVGYELGLRGMDICTGCGPGAMKGPMKGAAVGHAKQRIARGRYLGITEPGIIAAEAPNPIVNELVITPGIEMRLEAFVRLGHGFIVFPGGVGTAEELFCLLGVLLHPKNTDDVLPLILTGPTSTAGYFESIDAFIGETLGPQAQAKYEIIIDQPTEVARKISAGIERSRDYRAEQNDAGYFHWQLQIEPAFQTPFEPTHDSMARLNLSRELAPSRLAAALRRAFSGIVAANIKQSGKAATPDDPFVICGDDSVMGPLQRLLDQFVDQGRMTLNPATYAPCYRLESQK